MENTFLYMEDELRELRRDLHRIPELGLQEFKTSAYIETKLKEFGVIHIERVLDTGIVALIEGHDQSLPSLAFRADIDALPVDEATNMPHRSHHPGTMHACGHDGHMAMLLGFAKHLIANQPKCNVALIFQPAEEGPGGAQLMVKAGILKKYNITRIIGCHIFPDIPQGKIACRPGGMMARNGEVLVRIYGKSAHGAQPQLGHDALLASAAVLSALHTILSRNTSPIDGGVLTFGTIHGGEACNIIAKEVVLEGTMRAFSDEVYETIAKRVTEIVQNTSRSFGCTGEVEFRHMYRVVNNDLTMVHTLKEICGNDYIHTQPYMLAEDFSLFQREIPGIFFFLGAKNEEKGFIHPLHSAMFDFDERILCYGVETYTKLLAKLI